MKASLDLTNPQYPFYVLVPSDISEEITANLMECGIEVLFADNYSGDILSRDNKVEYWKDTVFKLKVFDLTMFDKIVFLDSDMIVLNNLDHLFERSHISCVAAGQELHSDWIDLNAGLMVIEPKHEEYVELENLIDPVYQKKHNAGKGMGDQDVIETFYSHWRDTPELHLDGRYNTMLGYGGYLRRSGLIHSSRDIYVYHFTGKQKPWRNKLSEDLAILAKIMKRSRSMIDFRVFLQYKCILNRHVNMQGEMQ